MNAIIDDLKDRDTSKLYKKQLAALPPDINQKIARQNRKAAEFVTHAQLFEAIEGMKRYTRHYVRDHGDSA